MQKQTKGQIQEEQKIIEQINKIVLLRLKSLIVESLKKDDIPQFERIIKLNNPNLLLNFAAKKIPNLSAIISQEIEIIRSEIHPTGKIL